MTTPGSVAEVCPLTAAHGFRQSRHPGRKETVNEHREGRWHGLAFESVPGHGECRGSTGVGGPSVARSVNGDEMSVLLYVVLTVAIFALLGLVQKLVEGL
jgi:hypothetical protein